MKKNIMKLQIFVIVVFVMTLSAEIVNKNTAEKIAMNWYNNYNSNPSKIDASIKQTINLDYNDENSIYAVIMEQGGFVMIAADDASIPVLGYSFNSEFKEDDLNPNVNYWFDKLHKEISYIRDNNINNSENLEKWNNILRNDFTTFKSKRNGKNVEPLLSALWSQGEPYNNYTPKINGESTVTGCVATAMALIMNYYQHPSHGTGSYSYNFQGQTLTADFGNTVYNWSVMADVASGSTDESKHEVAQISYQAGVSVDMQYGVGGSAAFSGWDYSMINYFNYSPTLENVTRGSIPDWIEMLYEEIDNSRPFYYIGYAPEGGHAFVCDGYQENDYFHFNWGWGGNDNGYFIVTALNTGSGNFNSGQFGMRNIIPDAEDVVIAQNIGDLILTDSEVIDLNEYFNSSLGNTISYSVAENSNSSAVLASISGSILTINRGSENGLSSIKIIAQTSEDQFFDIFDVRSRDNSPIAGFGTTYDFNGQSFINVESSNTLNEMEKISVLAWIKLNSSGQNHGIISKNTSTNNGWYLNVNTGRLEHFSHHFKVGSKDQLMNVLNLILLKTDAEYNYIKKIKGDAEEFELGFWNFNITEIPSLEKVCTYL